MQRSAHHHAPISSATIHREGLMRDEASFAHPYRNVGSLGIEKGMRIADFGSGSGAYVLAVAHALSGSGHVYAVDVQRDLLKRTKNEADREGYTNVSVLWGDLETAGGSKLGDRSVDYVLISNLLFQLINISAVLREAWRILKPSGHLAVIDWEDTFSAHGPRIGPHKNEVVTKAESLHHAREAGFELLKEFPAGAHHYGLIFRLTAPRT